LFTCRPVASIAGHSTNAAQNTHPALRAPTAASNPASINPNEAARGSNTATCGGSDRSRNQLIKT
jgi:hypothetical protein